MALRGRDDDGARRLRGTVIYRLLPEFRIQFHGVIGQQARLIDVGLLRKALRDRKHQPGRGNRHPDQVPKLDHANLFSLARIYHRLPNHWHHQISGMPRTQAIRVCRWNALNFCQSQIARKCPESLTSARATAASHRTRRPTCRRRRTNGLRTTTGAAPAAAVFAPDASMIAAPGLYLAAEYPIGPR